MSAIRISQPGQAVRLIRDDNGYETLTRRQLHILDIVRQYGGNRSAAARHLRVRTQTVQASLRVARHAGVRIPVGARRGRDLTPRRLDLRPTSADNSGNSRDASSP